MLSAACIALPAAVAPLLASAAWAADQPDSATADVVSRVQVSLVRIVMVHRAKTEVDQQTVTSPDQALQAIAARHAAGRYFADLLIARKSERSWIPVAVLR